MSSNIFISYARTDSECAVRLAEQLRAEGVRVWIDQLDIPTGSPWDVAVEHALKSCTRVLVILTPAAVASANVMDEVCYALDKGKTVIPAVYDECDIPLRLHRLQRVDIRRGIAELLRVLRREDQSTAAKPEAPGSPEAVASPLASESQTNRLAGTVRVNPRDGLEYVWIPSGDFIMGAVPGDIEATAVEAPQHPVRITKGFWIGKTPVTVAAYEQALPGMVGFRMPDAPSFSNPGWLKKDHPIVNVSWWAADAYCRWAGGRLPTEAQWEYSARGGKTGLRFPWGKNISPQRANYNRRSQGTTRVMQFPAQNDYGLYDVIGNVKQWCADYWGSKYFSTLPLTKPVDDPQGPEKGNAHVIRGGSYNDGTLRISHREGSVASREHPDIGFRCVLLDLP